MHPYDLGAYTPAIDVVYSLEILTSRPPKHDECDQDMLRCRSFVCKDTESTWLNVYMPIFTLDLRHLVSVVHTSFINEGSYHGRLYLTWRLRIQVKNRFI